MSSFRYTVLATLAAAFLALPLNHTTADESARESTAAGKGETSPVGKQIANFELKDYRGTACSLTDLADGKLAVIAFLGTECPLVKLYAPRLVELEKKYGGRGVVFFGINANRQDSLTEIAAYAREHQIGFPILKDVGNQVADQMGAIRTPEVFVLDASRTVRYWGRIDDQFGVGYIRDRATRHDLATALDELLAGKPVSTPVSASVGCYIGRLRDAKGGGEVTWSNQISRLFQQRCVECHRDGEIAPFSLTSYENAAGWAETIAEVVRERRMPPWHANPQYGRFGNARHLADDELNLILAWVKAGAPQGNPADLPQPVEYPVVGWNLGREPDLVVGMRKEPFRVPASGEVRYQYFTVDPGLTEDKWLEMAEILPGNRSVVHHVLVFARPPEGIANVSEAAGGFLVGYVPGLGERPLPPGMAKRIPAGSQLVFQVHYTPTGKPEEDLTKVGFVFAPSDSITHAVVTTRATQRNFSIPPYADNHPVEGWSQTGTGEVLLLSLMPHMHLRGKSFRYEAVFPDGRSEILLDVPHYDFNWQTSYRLEEPRKLPAGARMKCTAHFDNSENNLANPDPSKTVRWGDQTWDEMMIGYFDIAIPVEAYKQLADRGRKLPRPANGQPPADEEARSARQRADQIIARYDVNGDGKVLRAEVPERLQPLFDRLDRDQDGQLTADELARTLQQFPNLLR